jgi:predicted metal-dependent enzyme (double-stranded beta helix superfamily)
MAAAVYSLSDYVTDLGAITRETQDDEAIVERVRPLAKRLVLNKDWVDPRYYTCDEEQGFGVHLLHEEPDHTLAVFVLAWLPDRGTPAHDHRTWSVVAGIDGNEKNTFWKRIDDGSRPGYAELKWNGERVYGPGDAVSFLPHEIHTVWNDTDAVTLSLHTYGKHINFTGRSQFDPGQRTETPFVVKEE